MFCQQVFMPASPLGNDIFFVDGVHFASFSRSGKNWKMASITASWPEELTHAGINPDTQTLEGLASRGVWLKPVGAPPKLAVMCGGMGAAWPHMGRELYDNFPVCRAAMDKIAAIADWDILSLLDEPDLETINQTRLQIPYLFLLEYAQWSQFSALGLKPELMSGHSIGELMALCFAGVYSPETAWHIMDTRAEHIASLESRLNKGSGMLAISGNLEFLYKIMPQFSSVRIANNNTPTQVILSGPREDLLVIRKAMRKERIPAIMLNMNLAFHHPAMRYLRDLSLRRLNALDMKPPAIPVLSCSKVKLYPDDQGGICTFIADLDENMVDWVATLKSMENEFKVRHWLELGPQEILCGLTQDNLPGAETIPASRKGREAEFMARACARLYSLGLLDSEKLAARAKQHYLQAQPRKNSRGLSVASQEEETFPPEAEPALRILASVGGKDWQQLRPGMDLRTDLAIRSSRFPYVIQELEKAYKKQVPLEILFKIATIKDLLTEFTGLIKDKDSKREFRSIQPPHYFRTPPLLRWKIIPGGGIRQLPFCGSKIHDFSVPARLVLAIVLDGGIFPELLYFLGASGMTLALPSCLKEAAEPLLALSAKVLFFQSPATLDKDEWADAFGELHKKLGAPEALLFVAPPVRLNDRQSFSEDFDGLLRLSENFMAQVAPHAWTCHLQRIFATAEDLLAPRALEAIFDFPKKFNPALRIFWLAEEKGNVHAESCFAGSLLADDFWNKHKGLSIWKKADAGTEGHGVDFWPDHISGLVTPVRIDSRDWRASAANYQISSFQAPAVFISSEDIRDNSENHLSCRKIVGWGEIVNGLLNTLSGMHPRLFAAGISDLEFYDNLAICEGLTRELRFEIAFQAWMAQEGVQTLMAYSEIFCRPVAANGRMLSGWSKLARLVPLLTGVFTSIAPIWPVAATKLAWDAPNLRSNFFSYAGEWQNPNPVKRNLYERDCAEKPCRVFNFTLPARIADEKNWKYKYFTTLLDFSIAALWNCPLDGEKVATGEIPSSWRLASIGYVRFNWRLAALPTSPHIRIYIGETWRQADALRYNGQVESLDGELLMTFHSAEIEKRPIIK